MGRICHRRLATPLANAKFASFLLEPQMGKSPTGFPIQSPYVSIANRQAEIMVRVASEFGFTPASRVRIATPTEAEPTLFDSLDLPEEKG